MLCISEHFSDYVICAGIPSMSLGSSPSDFASSAQSVDIWPLCPSSSVLTDLGSTCWGWIRASGSLAGAVRVMLVVVSSVALLLSHFAMAACHSPAFQLTLSLLQSFGFHFDPFAVLVKVWLYVCWLSSMLISCATTCTLLSSTVGIS